MASFVFVFFFCFFVITRKKGAGMTRVGENTQQNNECTCVLSRWNRVGSRSQVLDIHKWLQSDEQTMTNPLTHKLWGKFKNIYIYIHRYYVLLPIVLFWRTQERDNKTTLFLGGFVAAGSQRGRCHLSGREAQQGRRSIPPAEADVCSFVGALFWSGAGHSLQSRAIMSLDKGAVWIQLVSFLSLSLNNEWKLSSYVERSSISAGEKANCQGPWVFKRMLCFLWTVKICKMMEWYLLFHIHSVWFFCDMTR